MTFTEHPRLLSRVAGLFYLIITALALFAYMYVYGHVICLWRYGSDRDKPPGT
jgi:hypothetical protein